MDSFHMEVPVLADHERTDTGCSVEDLPGAINDRDEWRESGKCMLAVWLDDDYY